MNKLTFAIMLAALIFLLLVSMIIMRMGVDHTRFAGAVASDALPVFLPMGLALVGMVIGYITAKSRYEYSN